MSTRSNSIASSPPVPAEDVMARLCALERRVAQLEAAAPRDAEDAWLREVLPTATRGLVFSAQELSDALTAARARHGQLICQREERLAQLRDHQAAAFREIGPAAPMIHDEQASALEAEIAQAGERVAALDRAVGQARLDGRATREQVQAELRQAAAAEVDRIVGTVNAHLDVVEPLAQRLEQLHRSGLARIPMGSPIVLDSIQKFRRG